MTIVFCFIRFVFEGSPPALKQSHALKERKEKREKAQKMLEHALENNADPQNIMALRRSLVVPNATQNDDVRKLIQSFGLPFVNAVSEAEAQCVEFVLSGLADAVATEDMDVLPLGGAKMIRGLSSTSNTVEEISLTAVLTGFDMKQDEFIDFCILCGSDYCQTLNNIGPTRAMRAIKSHKTIEKILTVTDKSKVPANWEYKEARDLFKKPTTTPTYDFVVSNFIISVFFFWLYRQFHFI